MKKGTRKFVIISLIFFAFAIIARFSPYDNTDAKPNRSGLKLYTDHLTGCQYLKAGIFGGTTPRNDVNGDQICIE